MEERPAASAASAPAADLGRAGARVLVLLANPLNLRTLRAHADGPLRAAELNEKVGWPAQTTFRAAVATFRRLGLLERREVSSLPYGVATELTPAGAEMLQVADVLAAWLSTAPQGPIPADSDAAKAAVKALAGGWSSSMVRTLASQPSSLTELDKQITDLSYPSLERRLSRMRSTHQIEPAQAAARGAPFQVTDWLRRSIAPLCVAARWEERHLGEDTVPVSAVEIEAAFLLALPLAVLPPGANGECRLAALVDSAEPPESPRALAGVTARILGGRVVSATADQDRETPTWAVGSAGTWLEAIVDGQLEGLRIGGVNPQLTLDLLRGVHGALFGDVDTANN